MKLPILVVDDSQEACNMMARLLAALGYRTDVAYDGPSALQRIGQRQYGLAILDYQMPGMNGVELFRCMHRSKPDMAGIVVTGFPRIDVVFSAIEAGLLQVFSKPVDFQKLIPVIDEHLRTMANTQDGYERTTLAATRLYHLADRGEINLTQSEKDELTTDYLFVLAITNKVELNQNDKNRLRSLHLAQLAAVGKIDLSQEDKDRLPIDVLIDLVLDGVTALSVNDEARLTADDIECLNQFQAGYFEGVSVT